MSYSNHNLIARTHIQLLRTNCILVNLVNGKWTTIQIHSLNVILVLSDYNRSTLELKDIHKRGNTTMMSWKKYFK